MLKSDSLFYLLGLICGKGNILGKNNFAINFNHKDKFLEGIAHCPDCGWLATGFSDLLKCKNPICKNSKSDCIDRNIRKIFNQQELARKSIDEIIIHFLKKNIYFNYEILSTDTVTILVIEDIEKEINDYIINFFEGKTGFDNFHINNDLYKENHKFKIEFINGILDTCGFFNQGNWYPRTGKHGNTRMRVYLQIVRNWKLPIQLDNFLRYNFKIPIQTIRWGHPNIVDPFLDYFHHQKKPNSAFKEHQIKLLPESLTDFTIRLEPKRTLFKELLDHNIKVDFHNPKEDWFEAKRKIEEKKIKSLHPLNNDIRISEEVRGKHINASWQINLLMGCKFLNAEKNMSKNKKVYEISGDMNETNFAKIKSRFSECALKNYKKIVNSKPRKKEKEKKVSKGLDERRDTYEYLIKWLKIYIKEKFNEESEVFDTSSQTLANYFSMNFKKSDGFREKIKNLDDLNIRPDVIGISNKTNKMFFIESKVVSLGVKELGQIWAYSVIANPFQSFLISTEEISRSLLNIYAQSREKKFLNFSENKEIILGRLDLREGVKLFNV